MPRISWRFPILVAGLILVGIETYGSGSYLFSRDGGFSYMVVAGAACTIISGFLPWIGERAWKDGQWLAAVFAFLIFPAAISTIVFAAIERSGTAMDRANATVAQQSRRIEIADDAVTDARAALANATEAASQECASGRGPKCQSLEIREHEAQNALAAARSAASNTGPKKTNPLIARLVAMLPISEEKASLYEPLVLPITLSLLSVLCVALGLGRPRQKTQLASEGYAAELPAVLPPKRGSVAPFMADCLTRAEGRRVARSDLFDVYCDWCETKGLAAIGSDEFDRRLTDLCEAAGIRRGKGRSLVNVSIAS